LTEDTQSWLDRLRKFGSDLGLPKVDVDQLIDAHRKNLDAVDRSAKVAAEGAKSLADKQRERVRSPRLPRWRATSSRRETLSKS
jgi:hypothetical protein